MGDAEGDSPSDLADFDDPKSAAAAAGPADEKLAIEEGSSCFFFPPNKEPNKPSFSLPFLSFFSFFEKNPPFFSFSFSLTLLAVEAPDSVRASLGRSGMGGDRSGSRPLCCCNAIPGGTLDRGAGGAIPGGNSYWEDGNRCDGAVGFIKPPRKSEGTCSEISLGRVGAPGRVSPNSSPGEGRLKPSSGSLTDSCVGVRSCSSLNQS